MRDTACPISTRGGGPRHTPRPTPRRLGAGKRRRETTGAAQPRPPPPYCCPYPCPYCTLPPSLPSRSFDPCCARPVARGAGAPHKDDVVGRADHVRLRHGHVHRLDAHVPGEVCVSVSDTLSRSRTCAARSPFPPALTRHVSGRAARFAAGRMVGRGDLLAQRRVLGGLDRRQPRRAG